MSISTALADALRDFAALERVLIASDFDGVLAPLVQNPLDSRATPGTLAALAALSKDDGVCAAIASGRDLAMLKALTHFDGSDVVLIGSHGAQSSADLTGKALVLTEEQSTALLLVTTALEELATRFGARVEHKPAGVVLHTRGLPADAATQATRAALTLSEVRGVHAMSGKSVVEFSVVETSKGSALSALARERGAQAIFYMGDDVTDETAFTVLPSPAGNVTLKVGEGETAAAFRIDIEDVVNVLETLVDLRAKQR